MRKRERDRANERARERETEDDGAGDDDNDALGGVQDRGGGSADFGCELERELVVDEEEQPLQPRHRASVSVCEMLSIRVDACEMKLVRPQTLERLSTT